MAHRRFLKFMPRHCCVEKIVKFLLRGRTLQRLDAVVDLGNLRLAGAEKTLRLKQQSMSLVLLMMLVGKGDFSF